TLLELKTPLGVNAVLINAFEGSDAISDIFQFKLDLLAEVNKPINIRNLLGKAVSLSMLDLDNRKRYFHGIVSHISMGAREDRFVHYEAVIVPWLWLLSLKSESRIFQDKTVVEIIKEVFDELKGVFPDVSYRDATIGS